MVNTISPTVYGCALRLVIFAPWTWVYLLIYHGSSPPIIVYGVYPLFVVTQNFKFAKAEWERGSRKEVFTK